MIQVQRFDHGARTRGERERELRARALRFADVIERKRRRVWPWVVLLVSCAAVVEALR